MSTHRTSVTRLVRKQAPTVTGAHHAIGPGAPGPDAPAIRREVEALSRCDAPGIVQLVGFGEHPVTWLETSDAGAHTMASPPSSAVDRLAALAALARVLAGLHRRGWVHLSLQPEHVIWRRRTAAGRDASHSDGDIDVTLCSLGSAVAPAGPAERAADREALAAIIASTLIAPGSDAFTPELRSALGAVAVDLRSGDLDDLDALAAGLDDLATAAGRPMPPTTDTQRSGLGEQRWFAELPRRLSSRSLVRLGLAVALGVAMLGGGAALAARSHGAERSGGSTGSTASAPCARPKVGPPRVDPDGSGCGQAVGYRSSVLTVGTDRWSLGDDIIDGRLVDLDGDGWSELAALRSDGEVFLVRRFPSDASDAVQVRSVANAPGARRLVQSSPGVGLDGLSAFGADGTATPILPVGAVPGSRPGSSTTTDSTDDPASRHGP